MATTANAPSSQSETHVVEEIPEALNQILLLVVKNFFSNEHYLVVYYILRAECIREENLRSRLNFDQKQLRQLLASLKAEKLVKERLLSQKNENGRTISIIFYFINYRAVLNVLRYKIDHMRMKIESREKDDLNKSHYKCTQCASKYELLEINKIMDSMTGSLRCWRCQGEVTMDESIAPSQMTRTAVARFNEQMTPLFSKIQELNGVQLAPHLLEPEISKFMEEDDKNRENQKMMLLDFSSTAPRAQLGGMSHSFHNVSSINYAHGDQITVDLNADINKKPVEEAKEVPLWLQDDAIGGADIQRNGADFGEALAQAADNSAVSLHLLTEIECGEDSPKAEEPDAKRMKEEVEDVGDEEEYEEEETVLVCGRQVLLSEVTQEMVEKMSEAERQHYSSAVQKNMIF